MKESNKAMRERDLHVKYIEDLALKFDQETETEVEQATNDFDN